MTHFTRAEIEEIAQRLAVKMKRDTDFPVAESLTGSEYVAIVQDAVNKIVSMDTIEETVLDPENEEFIAAIAAVIGNNYYNKTETDTLLSGKVDKVAGKGLSTNDYTDTEKSQVVHATEVIPSAASSENQLADKSFVNSSVATNTATFRGTSEPGLTEEQFLSWANGLTKDINDYVFWNTVDAVGNVVYKRYKYDGTAWVFEYDLNNSSFTSDQWAAINSGFTSNDKTKLNGIESGAQVNKLERVQINGTEQSISNKTVNLPAYPTTLPASDVYPWAKASTKPSYTLDEVPDGSTRKLSNYKTIDSLKSKGSTTKPVYFDSSGNAQPITSYEGNSATAANAKTEVKTDQEFVFRKTNVNWDAKSGVVKKIKGKTLAWNQLADPAKNISTNIGVEYNGITVDYDNVTGKYRVHGTATANYDRSIVEYVNATGHSYLLDAQGLPTGSAGNIRCYANTGAGNEAYNGDIKQSTNTAAIARIYVFVANGASVDMYFSLNIFDLSLATLADLTAAQFKALYPGVYFPNSGTLISNDAEAVETTGVNQWDEEWEIGALSPTGEEAPANNMIRAKNYIPVFPSTAYYIKAPVALGFALYDANYNFINLAAVSNTVITTPANAAFARFYVVPSYGVTYNHDICINLSDPSINGQYFPYWKRTLPLGITTKEDTDGNVPFADGMKGAGTARDWCDKVGGEIVIGEVDLGSLNYTYNAEGFFDARNTPITEAKRVINNTDIANIICSKYPTLAASDIYYGTSGNGIGFENTLTPSVRIRAVNAGTDAAALKASLNGVKLYFELATPVPFTWKEPLPSVYPCDQFGTERIISPESTTPSAPFVADLQYGAASSDIAFELNTIEVNYMSSGSMRNILDALVTAGLFASYTLTYNDATGKWDCAITPNS